MDSPNDAEKQLNTVVGIQTNVYIKVVLTVSTYRVNEQKLTLHYSYKTKSMMWHNSKLKENRAGQENKAKVPNYQLLQKI